jgi:ribosomal protein L11 methylase PrmA
MTHKYSQVFYDYIETGSLASAEIIVPILYDTVQFETLIDVGCGRGAWLSVFKQKGNASVFGMDGDYVNKTHLMISQDNFIPTDLNQPFPLIEKNMIY